MAGSQEGSPGDAIARVCPLPGQDGCLGGATSGGSRSSCHQPSESVEIRAEAADTDIIRCRLAPIFITPGELFDRRSILDIKRRRIKDAAKRVRIINDIAELPEIHMPEQKAEEIKPLLMELLSVNETLWDIEDFLRSCEARAVFDEGFIEASRAVYRYNDRRATLKSELDKSLGCVGGEVKQYVSYEVSDAATSPTR